MYIFKPSPRHVESETLRVGFRNLCFHKSSSKSDISEHLRPAGLGNGGLVGLQVKELGSSLNGHPH